MTTPTGPHPVGRGQGSVQRPAVYKTAPQHRLTWPQTSVVSLLGSLVWSKVLWLSWEVFAFLLGFSLQGRLKPPGSHRLGLHTHARGGTSLFGPRHAPMLTLHRDARTGFRALLQGAVLLEARGVESLSSLFSLELFRSRGAPSCRRGSWVDRPGLPLHSPGSQKGLGQTTWGRSTLGLRVNHVY